MQQSYYVVIVNVFSVILCILCFCFYFTLWVVVSAGYPALLSSSYFERINDDDDDDDIVIINAIIIIIMQHLTLRHIFLCTR